MAVTDQHGVRQRERRAPQAMPPPLAGQFICRGAIVVAEHGNHVDEIDQPPHRAIRPAVGGEQQRVRGRRGCDDAGDSGYARNREAQDRPAMAPRQVARTLAALRESVRRISGVLGLFQEAPPEWLLRRRWGVV